MNDSIFEEAMTIQGYSELSLKAMVLFAAAHKRKDEAKAIRAAWLCDPKPYARAAGMMPEWFDGTVDVGVWPMRSLIKIASVKDKWQRAMMCDDWRTYTLSYEEVRERVDRLNQREPREKKVRRCKVCGAEQP